MCLSDGSGWQKKLTRVVKSDLMAGGDDPRAGNEGDSNSARPAQ
jgi:hypothetical protein